MDFIKTKLETSVMEFYQERFSSPQRVESIDSGTAFILEHYRTHPLKAGQESFL